MRPGFELFMATIDQWLETRRMYAEAVANGCVTLSHVKAVEEAASEAQFAFDQAVAESIERKLI